MNHTKDVLDSMDIVEKVNLILGRAKEIKEEDDSKDEYSAYHLAANEFELRN